MKNPHVVFRVRSYRLLSSLIVAAVCLVCTAAYADDFEAEEITLSAKSLLGTASLRGQHYQINETVINKGFMNHYSVQSEFGNFEADSDKQLANLIREITAIAELQTLQKTDVFKNAAIGAVKKPIEMVQKISEQPVETLKGIPQGVGRLFKRTARQVSDAAKQAKGYADEQKQKRTDSSGDSATTSTDEMVEKGTEAGKKWGKSYLGQDKSIRALAKQLKVDPYSSNKVLQKEMADVAWVMTAGSFGAGQLVPGLPDEISTLNELNELVWDTHPVDLKLRNEKSLRNIGVSDLTINGFFENKQFTPSMRTKIVGSLEKLGKTKDIALLIQAATEAENKAEASSFGQIATAFAEYHSSSERVASIVASPVWPLLKTAKGKYVFMAPVDYLSWTENVSTAATKLIEQLQGSSGNNQLELRVQGRVSKLAQVKLKSLGWIVYEKGMK